MQVEDPVTREQALELMGQGMWSSMSTIDWLDRCVRLFPNKVALVDSRRSITFSELDALTDRVAIALQRLGLSRGDIIVAELPNVVEHLAVLWGGMKAGIVSTFVMTTLRAADMKYVLNYTEAKAVVVPGRYRNFDYAEMIGQLRPELPFLQHAIVVGDSVPNGLLSLNQLVEEASSVLLTAEDRRRLRPEPWPIVNINTTSGTTGAPKFALYRENHLIGRTLAERSALRPDDVFIAISPMNGGGAAPCKLEAPIGGNTVVLQERFEAEETLELIQRHKVTFACGVPAQMVKMLDVPTFGKYDLSSLRMFMYGGAVLPPEVAREFIARTGCRILTHYGSLDAGMFAATSIFDDQEELYGRVGRPMVGVEIRMLDDDHREVPVGEAGEIALRGPNVRSGGGYFKDPEANARAASSDGWFLTGDMGVQYPDGMIAIVGRKKDMIIRGGQNISPKEVEELLIAHPKVADVAVVAMPDRVMGEKACAYVALHAGQSFTFEEMVAFLKQKSIAPYKLPERLELIEQIPMAGDGQKVNKMALRQDVAQKLQAEGTI